MKSLWWKKLLIGKQIKAKETVFSDIYDDSQELFEKFFKSQQPIETDEEK